MNFAEIIKKYTSVSFVGICKNAGKTTAMNAIIKDLGNQAVTLGLTSIGRDGEAVDVVTGTKKPDIYVRAGTVMATASRMLSHCDITKEILAKTDIMTPLGDIILLRALSDGYVQLAGPSMNRQLMQITDELMKFGAEKILIDGAVGRKSLCSPKVAKAVILCSGASFHKDMDTVISHTQYTAKLLQLPKYADGGIKQVIIDNSEKEDRDSKYLLFTKEGDCLIPEPKELLWDILRQRQYANITTIFVKGALTDLAAKPLTKINGNLEGKQLVVKDSSQILLSKEIYERLGDMGLQILVLDPVTLLAITMNPFSAYGYDCEREDMRERLTKEISGIPIWDVKEQEA